MKKHQPFKLADISPGYASVRAIEPVGAYNTVISRRLGHVHKNGKWWIPVTRSRESHADQPKYPRFKTRASAAQALADGDVIY